MYGRGNVCFVGNLPGDIRERELEELFVKYGRIRNIDLKIPPRPPAFAFVEYEDPRDAEDACRGRDGYEFYGHRLRVEVARGGNTGGGGFVGGGGGGGGRSGGYDRGPPPAPTSFRGRGTGYRALVKGLPMSASWQDLKDHFRKVVKPSYTNVFRDRGGVMGVVEFETPDDLKRAIRKLDDTEFRNPFDRAYVRVVDDSDQRSRSRSRSPRRSYSRSRSRSRSVSRSPSRSKSRSPSRSKSRSKSRSRSASPTRASDKSRSRSRSPTRDD